MSESGSNTEKFSFSERSVCLTYTMQEILFKIQLSGMCNCHGQGECHFNQAQGQS